MKQDDKVSKFVAAITKEADERRAILMQEAEEFVAAEMKKAEEEALNESYVLIQRKVASIHTSVSRETSAFQQELKKSLFARREEITKEILSQAKAEIAAFTESDAYPDFLRRSCENARDRLGGDLTVYLCARDAGFEPLIKEILPDAKLETDDTIVLGGLKFRGGENRLFANDTMEERLNSQRHWFFEICGLDASMG